MENNEDKIFIEKLLSYTNEKLAITQKMMDEDDGCDYGHSQFLNGIYHAFDDIIFQLRKHQFKK